GGNAAGDGVTPHVLGAHRPGGDHRTVANIDTGRDIDVMAGPHVVADRHVLEHVGRALEPDETVVLVDPVERLGVILELVGAEPVCWMIEWVDRGSCAYRAKSANGRVRNAEIIVNANILTHNDVRTNLRILVEEQWPANRRLDDPGAGIEPDDAVEERGLAAGILEKINRDVGKLHGSIDASAPIEALRPKSR